MTEISDTNNNVHYSYLFSTTPSTVSKIDDHGQMNGHTNHDERFYAALSHSMPAANKAITQKKMGGRTDSTARRVTNIIILLSASQGSERRNSK